MERARERAGDHVRNARVVQPARHHLEVATDGGPIAVMIGPWGAHVQPHTGHPEGNVKADWYALWTPTRTSPGLVEVSWSDGSVTPGGCDPGARCAVATSDLDARMPWYRFPDDSVHVVRVELLGVQSADPYDGQSWELELELCPYRYVLGHVGAIAPELADAIVAAAARRATHRTSWASPRSSRPPCPTPAAACCA